MNDVSQIDEQLRCAESVISGLLQRGGPDRDDYDSLDQTISWLAKSIQSRPQAQPRIRALFADFAHRLGPLSLHGHAALKPFGYAGDFLIIDRIYGYESAATPETAKWDLFFQSRAAATAVRNRKDYFKNAIAKLMLRAQGSPVRVLNLGSGPGRDVFEALHAHKHAVIHFDCVDQDPHAIRYASNLCSSHADRVTFHQSNALRWKAPSAYDLIWSAGLFDYFSDRLFVAMVKRLLPQLKANGELIIGNFSPANPTRAYMELGCGWSLMHRDRHTLSSLARVAGVSASQISVGSEAQGVNLFLHIR